MVLKPIPTRKLPRKENLTPHQPMNEEKSTWSEAKGWGKSFFYLKRGVSDTKKMTLTSWGKKALAKTRKVEYGKKKKV